MSDRFGHTLTATFALGDDLNELYSSSFHFELSSVGIQDHISHRFYSFFLQTRLEKPKSLEAGKGIVSYASYYNRRSN